MYDLKINHYLMSLFSLISSLVPLFKSEEFYMCQVSNSVGCVFLF